jgi:hypothetical protein
MVSTQVVLCEKSQNTVVPPGTGRPHCDVRPRLTCIRLVRPAQRWLWELPLFQLFRLVHPNELLRTWLQSVCVIQPHYTASVFLQCVASYRRASWDHCDRIVMSARYLLASCSRGLRRGGSGSSPSSNSADSFTPTSYIARDGNQCVYSYHNT